MSNVLTCSTTTIHRAACSVVQVGTTTTWVPLPSWAVVGLFMAGTTEGITAAVGCLAVALVASAVGPLGDGEM